MSIETLGQARDLFRSPAADPGLCPSWFSSRVDDWVRLTAERHLSGHGETMVLALGGYGRQELYPFSDIDLLVCLPETGAPDPQALAEALFVPLWDSGFDVGHGIRTVSETLALAADDFEVLISLLDARLLHGPADAFEAFRRGVVESLVVPLRPQILQWLATRHDERHRRFGDAPHLLSPNLKEGRGGQRDLQTTQWLAALCAAGGRDFVLLSPSERDVLDQAAQVLSAARMALHRQGRRKNDTLHLELQPDIARALSYGPAAERGAVERFLSDLHRAMTEVRLLCRLCLDKSLRRDAAPGEDTGLDFSVLVDDPANILELFRHSARSGIPIGWHTRRIIRDRLATLSRTPDWQKAVTGRFQDLLCGPHAGGALEQMQETGFLSAFLPEFAAIEHLVQFDAYHRLPAGPHLVDTVRTLASFDRAHSFLGEFLAVRSEDPCLRWAALLHDIGKGNGDHALIGARLARDILTRLGHGDEFARECAFLVEHHLLLVHTATRLDLGAEAVIMELARQLGSVERLDALTLLTWADSTATGPKAWNPWVENLLRETYFKARKMLEHTVLSDHTQVHRLSTLRDSLRSLRPSGVSVQDFESLLAVMPPRYLLQTPLARIIEHMGLVRSFVSADASRPFDLSWERRPHSRSLRVTLVSRDRPGLFARFCAALDRHAMSVLAAELCVWDDGTVVDVFWVTEPLDMLYVEQTMDAFRASFAALFDDEGGLDRLPVRIAPKLKRAYARDPDLVRVGVDNEASDFHTVLSIQAPDVPGLLATVSLCLYRLGIDLVFAKIATQKDKAMDILHVREGGEKIPDSECQALERSLTLLICSLYA